jgi:hypothetical protein
MKNAVFSDVWPCRSCVNGRFGGMYLLHLQGKNPQARNEREVSKNAAFFIVTAMKTSMLQTQIMISIFLTRNHSIRRYTRVLRTLRQSPDALKLHLEWPFCCSMMTARSPVCEEDGETQDVLCCKGMDLVGFRVRTRVIWWFRINTPPSSSGQKTFYPGVETVQFDQAKLCHYPQGPNRQPHCHYRKGVSHSCM